MPSATDRLFSVAASVFGVSASSLDLESSPDTIPTWDSLNHLTMAMAVETEFGLEFTTDEVMEMRNLGAIAEALRARGVAA